MIPLPANLIVRWRWLIIATWALIAVLVVPVASDVHERLQVGGHKLKGDESTRADRIIQDRFATPFAAFGVVVLSHDSLTLDDAPFAAAADSIAEALERLPFVMRTVTWRESGAEELRSPDGRTTAVIAGLRVGEHQQPPSYVPRIRQALDTVRQEIAPGFTLNLTGGPAFDYDTRRVSAEDSARIERAVIPLCILALVLAFGTLAGAAMPVLVAFLAIEVTLGVVAMIATFTPMSIFVLNITTMVGLGVGIDYSLLVVTRFREEMAAGLSPKDAAVMTIRTASQAVLTSGATVIVGLMALFVVPLSETRSVGLGGILVVAAAMMISTTFLPAALAVVGRGVEWPRQLGRVLAPLRSEANWMRYAATISRHPLRAIVISVSIMTLLSLPAFWLRIGLPVAGWYPEDTEAGRGLAQLQRFSQGGSLQPVRVVLVMQDGSQILDLDRLRGLRALSDAIAADPRVARVRGLVDLRPGIPLWQYASVIYADTARARERMPDVFRSYLSRDGTAAIFDVMLADSVSLNASLDVVRFIRAIPFDTLPGLAQAEMLAGGFAPSSLDFRDELVRRFPLLVFLVLAVTAVMLGLVFRSVLVPIKAVFMNCFSVAAAFGMTVLVFQWGVGASVLGLPGATEAIFALGPALVFAIVFGLSMDYEVFLLARIKEEFDQSHDNDAATMAGLAATGATITNAALIMILVFGAFAFARVLAVQLVGFGLAVAVLLDATVIRMVMVPAVMHLAGRFNWWPGYRRRGAGGHYRRASAPKAGPGESAPR